MFVVKDQELMSIEAMKMNFEVTAEEDGIVQDLFVEDGQFVGADELLLEIE